MQIFFCNNNLIAYRNSIMTLVRVLESVQIFESPSVFLIFRGLESL